jgi:prepilin-type N-terminal cleavage/methylation domain-containing protein
MMPKSRIRTRRRGGFTLIETIVTVGLIAVIAAFVIPTVIQKAGSGDPVKVQNDLNTVRQAIETFATDVRNGFPHQISTLTAKPIAGVDRFLDSTAISPNQVDVWNGPYLAATITSAAGDSLQTGYTAFIMNYLDRYDINANTPQHTPTGGVNASFSMANTLFAAVQVHGLTLHQAQALNFLFDGNSDAGQADSSNTTGRFRWPHPATPGVVKSAWFLASPIT